MGGRAQRPALHRAPGGARPPQHRGDLRAPAGGQRELVTEGPDPLASRGRRIDPGELQGIFKLVQTARTVNRFGYVSIQRFYVYAERGLACKRVAVWIYEGQLRVKPA